MEESVAAEPEPSLMPAVVAGISDPKHAQLLLRVVNELHPLPNEGGHLKRIRKRAEVSAPSASAAISGVCGVSPPLEIIVCTGAPCRELCARQPALLREHSPDCEALLSTEFSALSAAAAQRLCSGSGCDQAEPLLRFHIAFVPDRSLRQSPELWATWNLVWPLAVPKPQPRELPSQALIDAVTEQFKLHVVPLSVRIADAQSPRLLPIVAVVIDPITQQVVASSEGCSALRVGNCLASCAYTPGGECGGEPSGVVLEHPVMYAIKRLALLRGGGGGDAHDAGGSAPARLGGSRRGAAGSVESVRDGEPYLANELDLYVSHEPCVMCAMALVHSRIGRVFYCFRNPVHGGLGSCFHVHSIPSLNHHFQAFHCYGAAAHFPRMMRGECGDTGACEGSASITELRYGAVL